MQEPTASQFIIHSVSSVNDVLSIRVNNKLRERRKKIR
jgi:hypothetical protein